MTESNYMRLALRLARKGGSLVFPNPLVGCVIVNNGKVVGKGYHERFGGPHAEINALSIAGEKAAGGTMFVTLEPCDHVGKTPPCTQAIIRAGIKRVVAAMPDPDKKVSGRGLRTLAKHRVKVSVGLLRHRARLLNRHYIESRRSVDARVTVKYAMSIDGKIAARTGDSKWISSKASRDIVHAMRGKVDAVVVGKNTVIQDDPRLTSHGRGRNPVRIVLDRNLEIPLTSRIFDGKAPTIVFHGKKAPGAKQAALKDKDVLGVGMPLVSGKFDFRDIIERLKSFSLSRILIEGGGETIAAALGAGVVTDMMIFIAPKIIGGKEAISPVGGVGTARVRNALRLRDSRVTKVGSDLLIRGKVQSHRSSKRK
jgi:diaminohydroxyphosphoribosylaminopyrimidine deaminase/5-amino-6-(5-phosphoribosylamino)uracil reductase